MILRAHWCDGAVNTLMIAAAHHIDVPEGTIPWESTTTLIPWGTNIGYSPRAPRTTRKGGGRGRYWLRGNLGHTDQCCGPALCTGHKTSPVDCCSYQATLLPVGPGPKHSGGGKCLMTAWRRNVLSYSCQPVPPWRRASQMISLQ